MWVRADIQADRDDRDRVIQWFVILTDITRERGTRAALNQLNAKLEQKVAERTVLAENRARQLQKLTVKLIEAEERERRRVTELLHNDLQQILAYGRLQFQLSGLELKDFTGPDKVDRILAKAIDKARRFSHGLSPKKLDGHSLFQSLQWLARQMDEQFGLKVRLIENSRHEFVHRHLKIFIFRSVQELLFNVYKHAGVKEADVSISASDTAIRVKVSDQDPGFARIEKNLKDTPDGFGLMSIRERALAIGAEFTINSAPGKGSRIELTIPIGILKTHPKEQEGETKQPISSVVLDELDHGIISCSIKQAMTPTLDHQGQSCLAGSGALIITASPFGGRDDTISISFPWYGPNVAGRQFARLFAARMLMKHFLPWDFPHYIGLRARLRVQKRCND